MPLRDRSGNIVSADAYKREVLQEISRRLDVIVPLGDVVTSKSGAYERVTQAVRAVGSKSVEIVHAVTPVYSSKARAVAAAGGDVIEIEHVLFKPAVSELSTTELADRMLAAVPLAGTANPLAEIVGPVYDTAGVQVVLGGNRESLLVSKQAVAARRERGTILALQTVDERWVYPVFQFEGRKVRADVLEVLAVFEQASSWSVAAWFQTRSEELDGDTPLDWLEYGAREPVLKLARRTAARWAA